MDNKEIIKLYYELKSVWKVGDAVGMSGQKVHSILNKMGINTSKKPEFTDEMTREIIDIYKNLKSGDGSIDDFSEKYKISRQNISRKARKLGISNPNRENHESLNKNISEHAKTRLKDNHPRGFLGKTHSTETRLILSGISKKTWNNKDHYLNSEEYKQSNSDKMYNLQKSGKIPRGYSRGKQGIYNVNGREIYFRSIWEPNYALYLDFLIKNKQIKKWDYETDTFWFEKIKRGVRSYKPDFKVVNTDDTIEYHEVKGYMDAKSKTKLKRMKIYFPDVKMILIDQKVYKDIIAKTSGIIKYFE